MGNFQRKSYVPAVQGRFRKNISRRSRDRHVHHQSSPKFEVYTDESDHSSQETTATLTSSSLNMLHYWVDRVSDIALDGSDLLAQAKYAQDPLVIKESFIDFWRTSAGSAIHLEWSSTLQVDTKIFDETVASSRSFMCSRQSLRYLNHATSHIDEDSEILKQVRRFDVASLEEKIELSRAIGRVVMNIISLHAIGVQRARSSNSVEICSKASMAHEVELRIVNSIPVRPSSCGNFFKLLSNDLYTYVTLMSPLRLPYGIAHIQGDIVIVDLSSNLETPW